MYPANHYMDPYYSHFRNHAPYPYYPPPGWEAGQPHMAMESSCRSPSYRPWAYSPSMSHLHPPESHSCCNHTHPPGYCSFRPPFPQDLPPPPMYYHSPFPHHPNAYPSYYPPPPPYPVDQTPYGHDMFKSHCCGCPNHVFHGGEKSNVKIEEERPEVEPDSKQKDADSFRMVRHPNYQFPVMWLPSDSMKDKKNGRHMELPPHFFNGWVPVSGKKTGDVNQQEKDDQKAKQHQWPIIWMPPGYDEQNQEVKELKEMNESPNVSKEAPPSPKIKVIPLSWFENGHTDQKPASKDGSHHDGRSSVKNQSASTEHQDGRAMEGNHKTLAPKKESEGNEPVPVREKYRTIPVMPMNDTEENKPISGNCRTIPVLPIKESDDKKPEVCEKKVEKKASNTEKSEENGKRSSGEPSKTKNSKLPPVCLRVDPLPKKKAGNGSSRSASPPTMKDVKERQSQKQETKQSEPKKVISVSEVKVKTPDEMDKEMGSSNGKLQVASVKHTQEEEVPASTPDQQVQNTSNKVDAQENTGEKILHGCEKSTKETEIQTQGEPVKDEVRTPRINFSESVATVRIQSAYRGYSVRRWQPLEKLRKIKTVHEQMQDVKKQLQDLESSPKQPTVKEQVAINETIMNLLLKLDTIQGLLPTVREARKSVARELVCLQERLDSLCKQPFSEPNQINGEEEKPEVVENVRQTTAPVSEVETSEEGEAAGVGEEPSSVDFDKRMHDAASSVVTQDTDSTEQNHQMEELSPIKEEAHEEGKAAAQSECHGAPSVDVIGDAALSGHSTEHKHQIEESNAISMEESPEEEKAPAPGEGRLSSGAIETLPDVAFSEDSNELKLCTDSSEGIHHTEGSDVVLSPDATDDSTVTMSTVENVVTADKDCLVEGQVREAAAIESSELKGDVPAEDQSEEPSGPVVNLEDSSVSFKNEEPQEHDHAPVNVSTMSIPAEQSEEARYANMQQQVADMDTTQDATKEADGTQEAVMGSTNSDKYATSADTEHHVQSHLLETTWGSHSTVEQAVEEEAESAKQCEVPGKNDPVLVSKLSECTVDNPSGDSANQEEPTLMSLGKEADIQEIAPREMGAEPILPETESCELSFEQEGDITPHENPEMSVSLESQTEVRKECIYDDSCCADVNVPKAVECKEMLEEAPLDAVGTNSAEVEADNLKEDVTVQTENKASEESASASAVPDGLQKENKASEEASATPTSPKNDEKKLAEENRQLKEMLQKLLSSGNDQMGVISELNEKVKTLEQKLARKKRARVRVHRPAKVH